MSPELQEDYYWELTLKDGSVLPIPPEGVPIVQRKMVAREPIRTTSRIVPFSEIKGFDKTSRRKTEQKLLEDASRAFNEPMFNEDGDILARWVKREVTQGEYDRYYAKSPSYQRLRNEDGMVVIAFAVPIHQINFNRVSYCTPDEERLLNRG